MPHHRGVARNRLAAVLASLCEADLNALRELAGEARGHPAGLLAAITHAADWEFHRCGGIDIEMPPLGEPISEGDLDAALGLAVAFHASIADRFKHPALVREMIVGVVETMSGTPSAQ
jgi:hypothetical protein